MARLNVDFSALHAAVAKMGASEIHFSIDISSRPLEPIDIQLEEGIEVPLDEIEHDSGLLSYQGRQILLYIKDHGWNVSNVIEGHALGNKYHVADCGTLQSMRQRNRFDRYVVTNKLTGEFEISGINSVTQEIQSGVARLKVCRNCLNKPSSCINIVSISHFTA
ncbi:MAG: hypothetical protein JMN25_18375 [gamma proteobacterium endosymbiont of Lamellibrachia anaximandri]|nr:hypothetical protein [gamma proteobacterium endosymbiont of Lamellibrachia anaximandri]